MNMVAIAMFAVSLNQYDRSLNSIPSDEFNIQQLYINNNLLYNKTHTNIDLCIGQDSNRIKNEKYTN